MASFLDESQVEIAMVDQLRAMGYGYAHGPAIAPDGEAPERADYADVVLVGRLRQAVASINPKIPADAQEEAIRRVIRHDSPSLIENNRAFHRLLVNGVEVTYRDDAGREVHDAVRLIDFDTPGDNDWLVVNQFTVIEGKGAEARNRRPDVLVFVNGLPIAVIELKNPADENAKLKSAYNQLQTYKNDIPGLMCFNELMVISDGLEAKAGTLTAGWDRFMPWRTTDGKEVAPTHLPQLEVLTEGLFEHGRLLDLIRSFVVFEDDGSGTSGIVKKMAAYHQYHAVNKAVGSTVKAASPDGDKRIGVVWHTQGSGKSLSMAFFAGKIIQQPEMQNPTIVVITDRNDLDGQLFDTFCGCHELLRQRPDQAESRGQLKELLHRASGGVIFTTIQKFTPDEKGEKYPELSDRRNIVVIADEAHRSQYGFIEGFARHLRDALPHASFIGFTGTPIEKADANTPAVFGNYIDIYDIQRAVEDKATVPIYYEGRLAKLTLKEDQKPLIDSEFEEVTEGEEDSVKGKIAGKWARLEAMAGAQPRIELIAQDLIKHFEERREAMEGKGLVVCMSRRICVELYEAIRKLRPEWHGDGDEAGALKVVMTGSASDPPEFQPHVRPKVRREAIAKRFKDPRDPLRLVIVRDMWLTGFDCPCLHTMYVDKPMAGHNLMQAIARVNRVFRDKPGGLVVDYLGLADDLKRALSTYTEAGGKGRGALDQAEAVAVLLEKFEVACGLMHGFDYAPYLGAGAANQIRGVRAGMEHILGQKDGKQRWVQVVTELSKAFALSVPHEDAIAIRDEVGFFQTVKAGLVKTTSGGRRTEDEMDAAVRQIVSKSVSSDEVMDIFKVAGLDRPDISILSDQFLGDVKGMEQKNLAVEVLRKLLNDEIKTGSRKNVVQSRKFSELLEQAVRRYQNRAIEAAEVIEHLIDLAKQMREAQKRGENLGLTDDEVAFYDALAENASAREVIGDDKLRLIAHELLQIVRRNVTIDWTVRETVRAKLRVMVRRVLRQYGYPPDLQDEATRLVLEQAEVICREII